MIQLLHLSKTYYASAGKGKAKKRGREVCALKDISLTFGNSGLVFICGRSGGGKSTLLNLLGGLDKPTGGEIIIDGKSTAEFSSSDYDGYRNSYVGFVFQEYNLIDSYNVGENVSLAFPSAEKGRSCAR